MISTVYLVLTEDSAPDTMALLPAMGTAKWHGPAGKYDSMCGQQLLDFGLLEILA